MLENNITTVNNDVKTLVKDAQALFSAAAALTGEKADEAKQRAAAIAKMFEMKVEHFRGNRGAIM